jgi:hypothetical protein
LCGDRYRYVGAGWQSWAIDIAQALPWVEQRGASSASVIFAVITAAKQRLIMRNRLFTASLVDFLALGIAALAEQAQCLDNLQKGRTPRTLPPSRISASLTACEFSDNSRIPRRPITTPES